MLLVAMKCFEKLGNKTLIAQKAEYSAGLNF